MDTKIIKNFRNLFLWQVLNRVISLIYFSFLTIKLGPEGYGILALILAVYEVSSIGFIGINNALQRYISESRQKSVLVNSLKLSFGFSFILSIFLFIFRDFISTILGQNITPFVVLLIPVLLISSVKEVLANALFGLKEFFSFIVVEAVHNISKLLLVSILIYLSFDIIGVLYGLAASALLAIFVALVLFRKVSFSYKPFETRKLFSYGIKFIFISFIYQLQPQVFIFYLSRFGSLVDVGYYKFLFNLVLIAVVMLPQTLSFLIFPYVSELVFKKKKKDLEKLFNSSFKIAFYLSVFSSIFFYLLIGFVINSFFKDYTSAIIFVPGFLLFGIVQSLGFVSATLMKATDSLGYYIRLTLITLITSLIVTPILIKLLGIHGAILSYSLAMFVITFILTFKMSKKIGVKLHLLPSSYDLQLIKKLIKHIIKF